MSIKHATLAMILIGCFAIWGMNARADDAPTLPPTPQATSSGSAQLQQTITEANVFRATLDKATARLSELEQQLRDQEQILRQETGRLEVLPAQMHEAAASLDTQAEALRLAQVGTQARRDAISEQIAVLGNRVADGIAHDDAVVALEKVVQSRQAALDMIAQQHKAGVVSDSDVKAAQAALDEAQAQVALERNRAAAAGGDIVTPLQRELVEQTITQREQDAQLKYLNNEIDRIRPGVLESSNLEALRHEIEIQRKVVDLSLIHI